jgi:hypothetical protein
VVDALPDEADEEAFPETEAEFVAALQNGADLPGTVLCEHDDVTTSEHPLTDGVLTGRVNVIDSSSAPASRVHLNDFVGSDDEHSDGDEVEPVPEPVFQPCSDAAFDEIQPFDA